MRLKINFRDSIKFYPLTILAIIIALFSTLSLMSFNFYVHELGHANSALIHSMINSNPSTTINFTYQDFIIFGKDTGLNYPQQTVAIMPKILFSYGVLFSIIFYALIFLVISRINIIKNNKLLSGSLAIAFLTLILHDVAANLFCGTDGFKLACSQTILEIISWVTLVILLLSLGFLFSILFLIIKSKFRMKKK